MTIRCDEAMRRSKENTSGADEFGIRKWQCTGKCEQCICAIEKDRNGFEHHLNFNGERGRRNDKFYDTIKTDNEEEQ